MASPFDISVVTDLSDVLGSWEEQYVSDVGFKKYVRAISWAMDETAKSVAVRMREVLPQVLDNPTPWTRRAFQYTRSLGKGRQPGSDGPSSSVFVMDDQSVVLKFLMGQGTNTRLPGDVGLARDHILLPMWKNLTDTQGIKPNRYGNLPGTAWRA